MRYVVLSLFVISAPLFGAEPTIEERLARLESQVRQLQVENQELREKLGVVPASPEVAPAPEAKPRIVVQAAGPERELQLGGLLQVQGESGGAIDSRYTDSHNRFFLRRARLNASGRFNESFDFRTEIEMTGSLGGATSLRAQLTDAYVTWIPSKPLNIRVGQFKTPFGFEQLYSDSRLFTPERSFGSDRLTLSRQIGIAASGSFSNGITYSAGAFNGSGTNTSANDSNQFLYAGRAAGTLWKGTLGSSAANFSAGVNGFTSGDASITLPADFGFGSGTFAGRRQGVGADAQFVTRPVEIWAEWLRDRFDPDSAALHSVDADSTSILAAYNIKPDKLQIVARYDSFDPGHHLSSTKTWDAGLNYYIHGHDLKLQLHLVRGRTGSISNDRVIARLQTMF